MTSTYPVGAAGGDQRQTELEQRESKAHSQHSELVARTEELSRMYM